MGWDLIPDSWEDAAEKGVEKLGEAVDSATDWGAERLDDIGWDSGADWLREKGDSAANYLGADVDEMQLGQTEDEKKLVHGSPEKLRTTAGHLSDFKTAFTNVGNGLKGLDSSHVKGQAADAFREKVAVEPKKWFAAADACDKGAKALRDFADTVSWAQGQAKEAVAQYKKGKQASDGYETKRKAYNDAVDDYNAKPADQRDPAGLPDNPGATDPGAADIKAAQDKLAEARRQRNSAAGPARTSVQAARDAAPAKPSYAEQAADGLDGLKLDAAHFGGGIVKGTAGLVSFARSVNPTDPYNITHPAEYLTQLNSTAAGLVRMANDPLGTAKTMWDTFTKDPGEGLGRLVPELLGTKGLGSVKKAVGAARHLPEVKKPPGRVNLEKDGPGQHSTPDGQRNTQGSDPIDFATGKMFLPQTDVTLPGALPLVFRRRAESGYGAGRWFGPSWSSTADQRLEIDAQGVVFVREDGLLLAYPHPAPGLPTLPAAGPRWPLERTVEGDYTATDPETGRVWHFTGPHGGGDGEALLEQISDRNGHRITFEYDAEGAPTSIVHDCGYHLKLTTEDGRITALRLAGAAQDGTDQPLLRYDYGAGNLTAVTGSSGLPLRFEYDERRRITAWTDTNDRAYAYAYDDQDRCVAEGGTEGHVALRVDYDGIDERTGHRVTTVTTPDGHATRHLIDRAYRTLAVTDPLGHTVRTESDRFGRVTARTDALGHTTAFAYDDAGHLTAVTRPDGHVSEIRYNDLGLPVALTEPGGARWIRTYDPRGNLTSVTDPAGHTTRYTHDTRGHLASVTDALGATTRVRCDAAGLPVEITDPLGAVTRYHRDGFGRTTAVTDPLGARTRLAWTPEGRLAGRTGPDGAQESWTYDGEGNLIAYVDAAGGTTSHEYTHFDLLAARTEPDGSRTEFEHDAGLRLTKVTSSQGLTWTYGYDAAGNLVSETDFDGHTLTYRNDAAGRLASRTNPLGQTVTYQRDPMGRIIGKDAEGRRTDYTYDAAGALLAASGPDAELLYQRDRLGRAKTQMVNGRITTHAYDALGRPTRRVTPAGTPSVFAYDAAGRRTALTASGHTLGFTHDAAGRETHRRIGDALTLTQAWDTAGRLTEQAMRGPAAELIQRRAYTHSPDGHLTGVSDHLSGDRTFTLDAAGRVTAVHAHRWTETYAYDAAGNQTHAAWPAHHPGTEATGPRAYTGTRIRSAGRVRYEHDAAGRITLRQKNRLSKKPDTWRYAWDAEDRLTSVTTPDGTVWRYLYDPLGRRIAKQRLAADGETVAEQVDFTWDGATLIEETTTGPHLPDPVSLTWEYEGLRPVTQTERITDATSQAEIDQRFFAIVTDLVGTPSELVDESGDIAWRTRTTLWGATTWNADATAYTPLRFPGQYFDPESGLHYNHHRYYDPETARYTAPDPLGLAPAPNPVTYVHNPHTWTDHLGLAPDYEETQVPDPKPDTLYHYTNESGHQGILDSGELRPSLKADNPKDARFGNGQYLSDIEPGTRTGGQLSRTFLGVPWAGRKFTHFLEIDVSDLPIRQGVDRPDVFLHPSEGPLGISDRIVRHGKN